ncbi:MAG: hypothetical protein OWS74_03420 [Firmicutes bacterium]|nr:hypothetical protein [Bacillota bacterium]
MAHHKSMEDINRQLRDIWQQVRTHKKTVPVGADTWPLQYPPVLPVHAVAVVYAHMPYEKALIEQLSCIRQTNDLQDSAKILWAAQQQQASYQKIADRLNAARRTAAEIVPLSVWAVLKGVERLSASSEFFDRQYQIFRQTVKILQPQAVIVADNAAAGYLMENEHLFWGVTMPCTPLIVRRNEEDAVQAAPSAPILSCFMEPTSCDMPTDE